MITANVPSAKKLIVHGPDLASIPSQYPIHEVSCDLACVRVCACVWSAYLAPVSQSLVQRKDVLLKMQDTQFAAILADSVEFFNIPEDEHSSHFLVDTKTSEQV